MGEPVGDRERAVFAEVPVVEDEQELAAVALQALDRVRDAGREVPQVPFADVVLEGAAFLVDGGDPRPALEHEGPLGRLVPVQLADPAGLEPHVDQGEVRGGGYLADRRLPRPAAFPHLDVAVGEGPSQGRQRAAVRRRRPEPVRALGLTSGVPRAEERRPLVATDRLGRVVAGLRRPGFGLPGPGQHRGRGGRNRRGPCQKVPRWISDIGPPFSSRSCETSDTCTCFILVLDEHHADRLRGRRGPLGTP